MMIFKSNSEPRTDVQMQQNTLISQLDALEESLFLIEMKLIASDLWMIILMMIFKSNSKTRIRLDAQMPLSILTLQLDAQEESLSLIEMKLIASD